MRATYPQKNSKKRVSDDELLAHFRALVAAQAASTSALGVPMATTPPAGTTRPVLRLRRGSPCPVQALEASRRAPGALDPHPRVSSAMGNRVLHQNYASQFS